MPGNGRTYRSALRQRSGRELLEMATQEQRLRYPHIENATVFGPLARGRPVVGAVVAIGQYLETDRMSQSPCAGRPDIYCVNTLIPTASPLIELYSGRQASPLASHIATFVIPPAEYDGLSSPLSNMPTKAKAITVRITLV